VVSGEASTDLVSEDGDCLCLNEAKDGAAEVAGALTGSSLLSLPSNIPCGPGFIKGGAG